MRSPLIQFCRSNPRLTLWVILAIAFACIGGIILTLMRLHALEKAQIILFGSVLFGLAPFAYQIIGDLAKRQEARKQTDRQELLTLVGDLRLEIQQARRDLDSRLDILESNLASHGHRAIQDLLQEVLQMATSNTTKLEVQTRFFDMQQQLRSLEKSVDSLKRQSDEQ
ncbi:MAG TPA: hypothetical protein V6C57_19960 [Coleofasciculaceae cyanobacterium]